MIKTIVKNTENTYGALDVNITWRISRIRYRVQVTKTNDVDVYLLYIHVNSFIQYCINLFPLLVLASGNRSLA